jgi:nucleoside-diphosphate-sugar epimerase
MGGTSLVTGGAGFIGSHLARALLARGEAVRVLDDFSSGRESNLREIRQDIELIRADLRDEKSVRQAVKGCRWVFHQAAMPSVPRSVAEPRLTHEVNVTGSLNLLLAARDLEVEAIVVASSSSVYGDSPSLPKHEEMPLRPLSPYAQQKLFLESLTQVYANCYGLRAIALRYFNVFGPRQDPLSPYAAVIPKFISALRRGEAPVIYGDGEQTRDFTFVENVVRANLLAAERGAPGLVCNIAGGQSVTISDLARRLAALLNVDIAPRLEPARMGDIKHSLASVERAERELGFISEVGLDEGLARTITAME